ncbi:MAG TPA: bifunctional UDP-N-acetylglucosamine diphosphorylase/glucosamine-1-phosphate N-acetyltransferase GlmU, partial [Nitriliruptorales bacterium]|nr:bifunctional UDP-N-acetylglucosamine diphosphorylase/glucosamine-1-phosphate N-acetyltransferase GlmU [Nitriliruptorales bacterium]
MTAPRRDELAAVVLAAGMGTRFRSDVAKVMHRVAGRTMLRHVLDALRPLGLRQVVVVVGHQAQEVAGEAAQAEVDHLVTVLQEEQLGTGHATAQGLALLDDAVRHVLVVPGDTPLLTPATLERLADGDGEATATLLTTEPEDPGGYGRIIHDDAGAVVGIVEETDASGEELAVREVNAGMYRFERAALAASLRQLDTDNAQGEQYLTDVVSILVGRGETVRALPAPFSEVSGVNDRGELATAGHVLRQRALERLMRQGVTVIDPATTYVDVGVTVGRDTVLLPGCLLEGDTTVGERATIGPYSRLVDAHVEDGARVAQSHVIAASIGPQADVGPFAYLRPGTRLERRAKAGAFVEMKNTTLGEASKAPHLAYLGDARVGRNVNFGAGSITVNYDGFDKHETVIEDGAFVGSDNMLVAPVHIGRGAVTGAGSVITHDVPDDALALERSEQRTLAGWAARR